MNNVIVYLRSVRLLKLIYIINILSCGVRHLRVPVASILFNSTHHVSLSPIICAQRKGRVVTKLFHSCTEVSCSRDRKSTRLNSSHVAISYAVFCLKKKNTQYE